MICQTKLKNLEVIITFNENYTRAGMEDVLDLLGAEDIMPLGGNTYAVSIDPLDYSKLCNLLTVENVMLTKPLDYGGY